MMMSAAGRGDGLSRWMERIEGGVVERRMEPEGVRRVVPSKMRTEWIRVVGIFEVEVGGCVYLKD